MKNIKNKFYIIILLFINLKINSTEIDIIKPAVSIFKNIFTKDLTGLINTASILGITSALKSNSKETFYGVALGAAATCTYYSLKYIPTFLEERKIQKKFSNHLNLEKEIINNKNNKNGILLNFIEQGITNNTNFYETVKNDKTLAFTSTYDENIKNNNLNTKNLNTTIDCRKKLLEKIPNNYNFLNLKDFYNKQYYENIIKTLNVNYKLEEQKEELEKILNKKQDNENNSNQNNNNKNFGVQINQQFNYIPISIERFIKLKEEASNSKKITEELSQNLLESSIYYEQQ